MDNYIEKATRTESIDLFKVDHPRLLHAAIGACTEVGELLLATDEINLKEEMGDICWYVAIACDETGTTFDDLLVLADQERVKNDPLKAMLGAVTDALDTIKRGLFYGIDLDEVAFCRHFGTLLASLRLIAKIAGYELEDLQTANIAKLSHRYPEKFTTEDAINRDTDVERKMLEQ